MLQILCSTSSKLYNYPPCFINPEIEKSEQHRGFKRLFSQLYKKYEKDHIPALLICSLYERQ